MKLSNPELRSQLAAEFALGTLTGPARKRFARLAQNDPALRAEVVFWNERLAELNTGLKPVAPSDSVWLSLERRLAQSRVADLAPVPVLPAANDGRYWRALALAASVAAVALGFGYYQETARRTGLEAQLQAALDRPLPAPVTVAVKEAMPYVASLHPEGGDALWMVSLSPEKKQMRVVLTGNKMPVDTRQNCLELWMVDASGTPHSLGVLPSDGNGTHDLPLPDMPTDATRITLAVSVEPRGGSPTGLPTGKVLLAVPAARAI